MKKILLLSLLVSIFLGIKGQNNALNFDGTDDYVEVPHTPSLLIGSNPYTLEIWFKAPNVNQFASLIGKRKPSAPFSNGGIFLHDGTDPRYTPQPGKKITFAFGHAGGSNPFRAITTVNDIADGQYHHVAGVADPSLGTVVLYIDGIQVPVNTISTGGFPVPSHTDRYTIGQNNSNNAYYTGLLDEVRIWNVARSQSLIQGSMNTELTGLESGLVSYFKFDDAISSCGVEDCNVNENHGARFGTSGANNLPQYSPDVPPITDIACGAAVSCANPPAVPTLSQWGLIILSLLFLSIGAVVLFYRNRTVPV